jgi:hypothetical protein
MGEHNSLMNLSEELEERDIRCSMKEGMLRIRGIEEGHLKVSVHAPSDRKDFDCDRIYSVMKEGMSGNEYGKDFATTEGAADFIEEEVC